jgi:4-amino-4-deoxy-L-arabinose transferase-like glycosyltransferase
MAQMGDLRRPMNRIAFRYLSIMLTAAFSLLFFWLCFFSAQQKSITHDEVAHIPAGYMIWKTGDFRMNIEHPPLVKLFATFPLLFFHFFTPTNDYDWLAGEEWHFGGYFLFQYNDADSIAMLARFPIMILGVILGWLVYFWGRRIFGSGKGALAHGAGLFAAALYFTEPNLIAHSSLVTYDLAFAFITFCAAYCYWALFVRGITARRLFGFVAFMVLAPMVKATGILLYVLIFIHLFAAAVLGRRWRVHLAKCRLRSLERRWQKLLAAMGALILCVGLCYLGAWASYGFRYEASPGHDMPPGPQSARYLDFSNIASPLMREPVAFLQRNHLLPQGYLGVIGHAAIERQRATYLLGKTRYEGGFYSYFLITTLLKTPFIHLAIMGIFAAMFIAQSLSVYAIGRKRRFQRQKFYIHRAAIPVYLTVGFFILISLARVDIGHRLILMIIPLECLLAGSTLYVLLSRIRRLGRNVLSGLVLVLLLLPALSSYPHYISYFNPLIGARRNAIHFLCDSNVDWGQDIKALGAYVRRHNIQKLNLSLFGKVDPYYYGIPSWIDIGSYEIIIPRFGSGPPDYTLPTAVSANMRGYIRKAHPLVLSTTQPELIGGSIFFYPPAAQP